MLVIKSTLVCPQAGLIVLLCWDLSTISLFLPLSLSLSLSLCYSGCVFLWWNCWLSIRHVYDFNIVVGRVGRWYCRHDTHCHILQGLRKSYGLPTILRQVTSAMAPTAGVPIISPYFLWWCYIFTEILFFNNNYLTPQTNPTMLS